MNNFPVGNGKFEKKKRIVSILRIIVQQQNASVGKIKIRVRYPVELIVKLLNYEVNLSVVR